MIVFLDIEKKYIFLYNDTTVKKIPFSEVSTLRNILKKEKVYYITNVVETTIENILLLVTKITGQKININDSPSKEISNKKYLHFPKNGTLLIPDCSFKIKGRYDLKLIDKEIEKEIKKSMIIKRMLKNEKLFIIGELDKEKLLTEFKRKQEEKDKLNKKKDKVLDKMILDKRVEDFDVSVDGEESEEGKDAIVIDILGPGELSDVGGIKTMSELNELYDE